MDPPADSKALRERLGLEFPLLYDEGARVAEAYGVKARGKDMAIPSTVIVTPGGEVAWEYIGEKVPDRPASQLVLEQLDKLK